MKHIKRFNESHNSALIALFIVWFIQGKFTIKNLKHNLDMWLRDFSKFLTNYGYPIDYEISKAMFMDIMDKASEKIEKLKI